MKSTITLEFPLLGGAEIITLPEPCTCCDAAIPNSSKPWEQKITYPLVDYYTSPKYPGLPSRPIVVNGQVQNGSVTLRAPYCRKHSKKITTFKYLNTSLTAVIMVAAFILYVIANDQNNGFRNSTFFEIFLPFSGIMVSAFILAMLINKLINSLIIVFNKDLKDYPTGGTGHWGLAVGDVRAEPAGPGTDWVIYYLPIELLNRESARRLISAYPQARVVKGKL
jgi:hypothetical protein